MKYPKFCVLMAAGGAIAIVWGLLSNPRELSGAGVAMIIFAILVALDVPERIERLLP